MAKTIDTGKGLDQLATLNDKTITIANRLHDDGGLPWGEIGAKVGMTAQAASRRFGQTGTITTSHAKATGRMTGTGGRGRGGRTG